MAVGQTVSILQFNMCGDSCNSGSLTVADDVVNSVNNHSPQPSVVTLEEVCQGHVHHIWSTLIPYYGMFIPTGAHPCANGDAFPAMQSC